MSGDWDEQAALDALGLLTDDERHAYAAARRDADGPSAEHAAFYETAAMLAWACPPVEPSPDVRRRLMAHVAAEPRSAPAPPLSYLMRDEGWQQHPLVGGITFKQLALDLDRNVATLLMKVAPGTIYPAHHHRGAEECYVIEGDVVAGGRLLHAGDFHHADAGTDHEPLRSDGGCTVLLVVDARDYLHP